MEFSPTKRKILGQQEAINQWMLNMQRKACCSLSLLLLAHILQWYFQDEHFTEQIRSFRVGESLECAAFCALVSVRDREEPLLWPIASASNAEDEIYNSAPRDECRLVLIRVFLLFLNMFQKYLPLCDVWVWASVSHQASALFICLYFQKKATLSLFHRSPGLHPELFLDLYLGFSFCHINVIPLSFFCVCVPFIT